MAVVLSIVLVVVAPALIGAYPKVEFIVKNRANWRNSLITWRVFTAYGGTENLCHHTRYVSWCFKFARINGHRTTAFSG